MAQRSKFLGAPSRKKFREPQEGHVVVRALLSLPKDIANAVSFTYYKYEQNQEPEARGACRGVWVSGGDLCEAEAPTEPAGEYEPFCPCQKKSPDVFESKWFRTKNPVLFAEEKPPFLRPPGIEPENHPKLNIIYI